MKTQPNDPIAYVDELQAIEGSEDYNRFLNYGLTKREYFAIKLLQGLYANSGLNEFTEYGSNTPSFLIGKAVQGADLLIEELNK
jgi:hypothetical protein